MEGCQYRYNPSELYQRGMINETHCGAPTQHGYDLVDQEYIHPGDGLLHVRKVRQRKDTDDPFCPLHGGTPAPATAIYDDAPAPAPKPVAIRDEDEPESPVAPVPAPPVDTVKAPADRKAVTSLTGAE